MAEKRIQRETQSSSTTINDLQSDLLKLILARLEQESLQSISLVSPLFAELINMFISKLTFKHLLSNSRFQLIFDRFYSVKEINLKLTAVGRALTAISNSSLPIEVLKIYGNPSYPSRSTFLKLQSSPGKLKNVKSLKVGWFRHRIGFRRMVEFIKIFSGIYVLELSSGGRWVDDGIELLAKNVPNLRGVTIVENELMSQSLDVLAHFCKGLQFLYLEGRSGVRPEAICGFISRMPNLQALRLPVFSGFFTHAGLLQLGNAIGTLKELTQLGFYDYLVTDDVLEAIGKSELRLTSLEVLKFGTRGLYTMKGLGALLNASRSLTSLKLHLPELDLGNQDHEMSQLVKLLPHLKRIQINTHNWFHETLFSLIENCRKLESIVIIGNEGKCGSDIHVTPPQKKNFSIEYIRIGPRLEESLQTTLRSSCPVLKWLESS